MTTESKIIARYVERTPKSAQAAAAAQNAFPSGVTHDGRYLKPHPTYICRGVGARKWDLDGNEYVDYAGGHGALLLGHNHPAVMEAVQEQLQRGTHFGSCHEGETEWGETVKRLVPSAQRVRFTSSGTEATLLALRLARAHTGKPKLMHFRGHFHGWHDHVAFGVNSHFDGTPTAGVLEGVASGVVMAPAGDVEGTRELMDQHDDLAAVIVEPTGASWGQVPLAVEFLQSLRELTAERGIVLIFDEVISGFRCSPGGAQAAYGITPDMTTLAKILAGGFPGGAVSGREDIMEGLAFRAPDDPREKISHHGTFNANPISAAAGVACLKVVAETGACERANNYAAQLRAALNGVLKEEDVPWVVYGTFSSFHILTELPEPNVTPEEIEAGKFDYPVFKTRRHPETVRMLRLAMLNHGVDLFGWPGGPTSAAHSDAELNHTAEAFRNALTDLKEEGHIHAPEEASQAAAK